MKVKDIVKLMDYNSFFLATREDIIEVGLLEDFVGEYSKYLGYEVIGMEMHHNGCEYIGILLYIKEN